VASRLHSDEQGTIHHVQISIEETKVASRLHDRPNSSSINDIGFECWTLLYRGLQFSF